MSEPEPVATRRLGRGHVALALTNVVLVALVLLLLWKCADLQRRNDRLELERLQLEIDRTQEKLRSLEGRVRQAS